MPTTGCDAPTGSRSARSGRFATTGLAAVLLAAVSGCGVVYPAGALLGALGIGGDGGGSVTVGEATAEITALPPAGEEVQDVHVRLADATGAPAALKLEFRGGGDDDFRAATLIGVRLAENDARIADHPDGVTETGELDTSPEGVDYVLEWRWTDDLAEPDTGVALRLSIVGSAERPGGVAFTLDGQTIGNHPPAVEAVQVVGTSGDVVVRFLVSDPVGSALRVTPSFQVDDGDFAPMTALDADALALLQDLPATAEPAEVRLTWRTREEPAIGNERVTVVVRIEAEDAAGLTSQAQSTAVAILNREPPVATLLHVPARAHTRQTTIVFALADDESAPADVVVRFERLDGAPLPEGSTGVATPAPGSEPLTDLATAPEGVEHSFVWAYADDLGDNRPAIVRVLVEPQALGAAPAYSGAFLVGNDAPVAALLDVPQAGTGDVAIDFALSDSTGDSAFVELQRSTDGGVTFQTATTTGDTVGLAPGPVGSPNAYTLIWRSAADLPSADDQAVRLRIRANDALTDGEQPFGDAFETIHVTNASGGDPGDPGTGPPPTVTGIAPTSGPAIGGTSVTVNGTGFVEAGTAVTIGGAALDAVVVTSSTQLTGTTAPGIAGPADVVVSTPAGSGEIEDAFTYTTDGPPTLTSIHPSEGPLAGGTLVAVSGSGFYAAGAMAVTLDDAPLMDVQVLRGTLLTGRTPPGAPGVLADLRVTIIDTGAEAVLADAFAYLPAARFARAATIGTDAPHATYEVPVTLDLGGGGALTAPVTVEVIDTGEGSGVRGEDYALDGPTWTVDGSGVPAATVEFPAGAPDGAVETVPVRILTYRGPEERRAVSLRLRRAAADGAAAALLDAPTAHQVILPENDAVIASFTSPRRTLIREAVPFAWEVSDGATVHRALVDAAGAALAEATGLDGASAVALPADPGALGARAAVTLRAAHPGMRTRPGLAGARAVAEASGVINPRAVAALEDGGVVIAARYTLAAGEDVTLLDADGEAAQVIEPVHAGAGESLAARVGPDGGVLWARQLAGPPGAAGAVYVNGVAPGPEGGAIVAGRFENALDLGEDQTGAAAAFTAGGSEHFVAALSPAGALLWARAGGGAADSPGREALAVAAFPDGGAAVAGAFDGDLPDPAVFGHGEPNEAALEGEGRTAFVARHRTDGALMWARRMGGATDADAARAIAAFPDGSVVVAGTVAGTAADPATFDGGSAAPVALDTGGEAHGFLARYRADGTLDWVETLAVASDPGLLELAGIAAMPGGGLAVAGHFEGELDLGGAAPLAAPDRRELFVARYHPYGGLDWARQAGGDAALEALALGAHPDGGVALSARFTGAAGDAVTFGAGELHAVTLTGRGGLETAVAAYRPDGALRWAVLGGEAAGASAALAAALPDGGVATVGAFTDPVRFAPEASGGDDVLVEATRTDHASGLVLARHVAVNERQRALRPAGLGWLASMRGLAPVRRVDAAPDGSAVAVGTYRGSPVRFLSATDGGPTFVEETTGIGHRRTYIASYHPNGDLRWLRTGGNASTGSTWGQGIAGFADGSAVATGYYTRNISARFGSFTLFGRAHRVAYAVRYDGDGEVAWAYRIGLQTQASNGGQSVAGRSDGSAVVGGRFHGPTSSTERTISFEYKGDPVDTESIVLPGNQAAAIGCYAPDGTLLWAGGGGSSSFIPVAGVAVDARDGALMIGRFRDIVTFETNVSAATAEVEVPGDAVQAGFVVRYDRDGEPDWALAVGAGADPYAAAPLPDGGFVLSGTIGQEVHFEAGPDGGEGITIGFPSTLAFFVARYRSDGTLVWARAIGQPGGSANWVSPIAVRADGRGLLLGGTFSGTIAFETEPHLADVTLAATVAEAFLAELDPVTGLARWVRHIHGAPDDQYFYDMAPLADGGMVLVGEANVGTMFEEGDPQSAPLTDWQSFVVRYHGYDPEED